MHTASNPYGPVGKKLNLLDNYKRYYLEAPPSVIDGDQIVAKQVLYQRH